MDKTLRMLKNYTNTPVSLCTGIRERVVAPQEQYTLAFMQHEISAGIIVYRKTSQGLRFLLLYHGGRYWNFPKGHIEAEEKSLQAAIRETAEETGLKRTDLKINDTFKAYEKFTFFKEKNRVFKTVIFYLAETRNRDIHVSHEHDGFGWFSYKEAVNLLKKHKDSVALLKQVYWAITKPQQKPAA